MTLDITYNVSYSQLIKQINFTNRTYTQLHARKVNGCYYSKEYEEPKNYVDVKETIECFCWRYRVNQMKWNIVEQSSTMSLALSFLSSFHFIRFIENA